MKAMRKDRTRRYRSASELADDVQNYLTGTPLIAGPESNVYRARKFVHKHAGSVASAVLVAVVIVLGFITSTAFSFRAEKARGEEAAARTQAEQARDKEITLRKQLEQALIRVEKAEAIAKEQAEANRQALYFNRIAHAKAITEYASPAALRDILKSCSEDLRGWEWHYLWHISDQAILTTKGHSGHIYDIAWSPCGRYFASAGGSDKTARVWDAETATEILTLREREGYVVEVSFSKDGSLLAVVGGSDKFVRIYEIPSGTEIHRLQGHDKGIGSVAFSPSGKELVSGGVDGVIKIWDASTGANKVTLKGPDELVTSVAFRPGSNQIVSSSGKEVRVWDVATQTQVMTLEGHTDYLRSVAVTPDGKRIVSAGQDSMIKVWDALDGRELMTLRGHTATIHTVSISPDGTRLVSAGVDDKMIKVWDLDSGLELLTYRCDTWPDCAAFSPDGELIVSGSAYGEIRMWDAMRDPLGTTLEGHNGNVYPLAFSPDGKSIVSCSIGGAIKLWDVASGAEISTWGEFMSDTISVAFHPNGEEIALGKDDGRIVIWDTVRNRKIRTISGHEDGVTYLAFSSDGRRLVTGSLEKTVKVWNSITGNCELTLEGHKDRVRVVAFSPDGKRIASGGDDDFVRVWDASSGAEIMVFKGHKSDVILVTFTPDGRRIISGSKYGPVTVWDVQTGAELMVLEGHNLSTRAMAVSPDGRRIAYINPEGNTVVVLDTATGMQALTIPIPGKKLNRLVFSPNGRIIALAYDKGILLLESEVPVEGYKARREVRKGRELVERLYSEHHSYSEVADLLGADANYEKSVREKTLQICLSREWQDHDRAVDESFEISRIAGNDIAAYQRALQQAELANNSQSDDPFGLLTLGMAQYRVGAYEEARKSLLRANEIWMSFHKDAHLLSPVFLAMTQYQLGQVDEGRSAVNAFRDSLEKIRFADITSGKLSGWIEAEKVFAGTHEQLLAIWDLISTKKLDQAVAMFAEIRPSLEEADSDFAFSLEGISKYLSRACYTRGKSRLLDKDQGYIDRASDYEAAVSVDPNYVSALKDLAWLRVACTVEEVRTPTRAVELAVQVCELTDWKNHECLSVLAGAYSESERFSDAVKWQQEAIALLSEEDQTKWKGNYAERLRLYQSSMPYSAGGRWSFTNGKIVAAWDFEDIKDGVVKNHVVGGPKGKLVDGAEIVPDVERGNVLDLHGKGGMECPQDAAFDISGAMSVGAWIKVRTSAEGEGWHVIVSKDNRSWAMSYDSDDDCVLMSINILKNEEYLQGLTKNPIQYNTVSKDVDLRDERWHHVAGTYDGEKVCLYIDGKLGNSKRIRGNIATNTSTVVVGDNLEWSGPGYRWNWNGLIDDVRIYSYAWSAEEVKGLYEGREPPRKRMPDRTE